VGLESAETLADGIAVKRIGERTFPIIRELVDEVVTVAEEDIARAILLLLERQRTVVEGAGAVPLAALMSGKVAVEADESVAGILCGGNIDVNMVARIIERGLVGDGRMAHLIVKVRDHRGPGGGGNPCGGGYLGARLLPLQGAESKGGRQEEDSPWAHPGSYGGWNVT
jgi:threonine dehydratase